MCGIVAVLARPSRRAVPEATEIEALLAEAEDSLARGDLAAGARSLRDADTLLGGEPGLRALVTLPSLAGRVSEAVASMSAGLTAVDPAGEDLEARNQALTQIRDHLWALEHDRVGQAKQVAQLAGDSNDAPAALRAYRAIEIVLAGIDRLEVRGRDSAGVHVLVTGHGLDLEVPDIAAAIAEREADQLFTSGAVRVAPDRSWMAFVYKAAAEVGELGDNIAAIRAAVTNDDLLRQALGAGEAQATVLGHTRWASVGIISEPNAHPVESAEVDAPRLPYVVASLNGDVDNHEALVAVEDLDFPVEIGTDAKVIPTLVARGMAAGASASTAFREAVARFEGSVAIAAGSAENPDQLLLALRGSGQALYVGLAEDAWLVASEPYGLVEQTSCYLRLDGEKPGPTGVAGQVAVLERSSAGEVDGLNRLSYDGSKLAIEESEVRVADMTTRDIDRGGFPHFLLKELTESPDSMRKTLLGRVLTDERGHRSVRLPGTSLSEGLRQRLRDGRVRRVVVMGQGTAAIAGRAVAAAIRRWTGGLLVSEAVAATELSGFGMDDDMSDTLVVAVSQSGTTADTNRTVDLVRSRGAEVVSIVNRRGSDLVSKSDGVIYTSDGRDIEMAVPSTKAFYMQVAAGQLLAVALGQELGTARPEDVDTVLAGLEDLPLAMESVLARRDAAAAAARLSLSKRFWGVIGNADNRIAAEEIRIKLSELAYRSVSCDATEDKKHIDLSCEPLILLCAAGLQGPNADDAAKEIAILKAHKATPIVIATEGEQASRFTSASAVLEVPVAHPDLAFVLSALAGHLFGYEAALAIDAQARELRAMRSIVDEALVAPGAEHARLDRLSPRLEPAASVFFQRLRSAEYDGNLEPSVAVRLALLLRYALGVVPLDVYELEHGRLGSPTAVLTDLAEVLSQAIDQLRRPIDAIRHQAKTVTVGISRSEEELFNVPLVAAVLATGASREGVGYRALRTIAALDPIVASIPGWTRYRIEGSIEDGSARLAIVDRGGVSLDIASRTETDAVLRGTKHRAVDEREVTVARGRRDGRTFILVPETKNGEAVGLSLVFIDVLDRLPGTVTAGVLAGYRDRWSALVDAVTETEPELDLEQLEQIPVVEVLTEPVNVLAEHFRS